jgi:hypothetical protein
MVNPMKRMLRVSDYGSYSSEDIGRICHRIDPSMYPQGSFITSNWAGEDKSRWAEVEGDLTKDTVQRIVESPTGLTCILTFEDLMSVGYPTVEQDWIVDVIHPMNEGYLIVPEPRKVYIITPSKGCTFYGYYDTVLGKMEVFKSSTVPSYSSYYTDTLVYSTPAISCLIEYTYKGILMVGSCMYRIEKERYFHIDLPTPRLNRYYGFDDLPLGNLVDDLKLKPYLNLRQHEIDSYRRHDSIWKGYFRPANP